MPGAPARLLAAVCALARGGLARAADDALAQQLLGGGAGVRALGAFCPAAPGGGRGPCRLAPGRPAGADAVAELEDSVSSRGFALLRVTGRAGAAPRDLAYAAGVAEGALTAARIAQALNASLAAEFGGAPELWSRAADFLRRNDGYVRERVAAAAEGEGADGYWSQVGLVWAQLDGLLEGVRLARASGVAAHAVDRTGLLFLNALVDLSTVVDRPFAAAGRGLPADPARWTPGQAAAFASYGTHCSALVKLSADFSDLWTAHNTWTGFFTMLRVAKLYDLPLPGAAATKSAFPGYFGALSSLDDFFVLSSGMVVQETTNSVFPPRKGMCTPYSVLTWARTVLANRMATDGRSWTEWFSQENSGTINNQWMVVDYNRFTPGSPLQNGTLWVLEQLPGFIESADMTPQLRISHWPSFNQPYFPAVRNLSGNDAMAARFGLQYTYDLNPRAKLFRRDAPKVQSRKELRRFMRYNDWRHDPLSAAGYGGATEPRSAENAIAARSDLIPREAATPEQAALRGAHGNTDAKLVGRGDVRGMRFDFVVGPTHDDQPVFTWAGEWAATPHDGHPEAFNFTWASADFSRLDRPAEEGGEPAAQVFAV